MNENPAPKFCINCKHIGRNGADDWCKFRCFAPANIRSAKPNLVTGVAITQFVHETCQTARIDYPIESCGTSGKWFEPKPPLEFTVPSAPTKRQNADDLLLQLGKFK